MNDTLSIKPILPAQIGSTQLGSASDFARSTTSDANMFARVNTALGLLNPTTLLIGHYPKSKKQAMQRSLVVLKQRFSRVDSSSGAVVASQDPSIKLTSDIPEGVSQAELDAMLVQLVGFLTENGLQHWHELCEMQR